MHNLAKISCLSLAVALSGLAPQIVEAGRHCGEETCGGGGGGGKGGNGGNDGGTGGGGLAWAHEDVAEAQKTYTGVGTHMIILDNHTGGATYAGNLDGTDDVKTHGGWTSLTAHLVAPGASYVELDYPATNTGSIASSYSADAAIGLNVVNMSFGWVDPAGLNVDAALGEFYGSIVDEAEAGTAVFVKAAGNSNGAAVDDSFATILDGQIVTVVDYLNLGLIENGAQGALLVGALSKNGTVKKKASIARYSTIAGDDLTAQSMFLVVGVDAGKNGGLEGTSFAAPIVTGYAAILGDKFETATPAQIVDQLLDTARTDTIRGYDASVHGQGEASLANALAPNGIN